MSLPAGPRAQAKLAYYRRAKRRSKRDLSEFLRQGITPLAPFDFGTVAAGGISTNTLVLPANTKFAVELDAITAIGDVGIVDLTGTALLQTNRQAGAAGSIYRLDHKWRRDEGVRVFRDAAALAGSVNVYFDDGYGKLTLIGTATFT